MKPFFLNKPLAEKTEVAIPLHSMEDRQRGSIYDRLQVQAGTKLSERIVLFENPVGLDRSFVDTNMLLSGQLPARLDMIIERFLFVFQPTVIQPDIDVFLASYNWEFQILDKIYQREPLVRCSVVGKPEDLIPNFGKLRKGLEGENSTLRQLGRHVCWELGRERLYVLPLIPFRLILSGIPFEVAFDFDFYAMCEGLRGYPVQ